VSDSGLKLLKAIDNLMDIMGPGASADI